MKKRKETKGITLVALVVTIVVLLILAGITLNFVFGQEGLIEKAKWSAFVTRFREIEEKQQMYAAGKFLEEGISIEEKNGLTGKVTEEEKEEIKRNNITLERTMRRLAGLPVDALNIYWIDKKEIGTDQKARYILDVDNNQVYQYEGEKIYGLMWHTLEEGIEENGNIPNENEELPNEEDEIWNGWIKLTLYYPENATERQWRLGAEGEVRNDPSLQWQEYTEPIWVRIQDVENVWIRYKIDGEDVIVPPAGKLLVDIEADNYYPNLKESVRININYDKGAEIKEYKVGEGGWQEYTGPFTVSENVLVEARAKKVEKITDEEGNIIEERDVWGRDNLYIGNIGIEESQLGAPTITEVGKQGAEVARIKIDYPTEAAKKIYKINYGEETEYTGEIGIDKKGTYVIAYYYDAEGKRSKSAYWEIGEDGTIEKGDYTPNTPGNGEGGSNPIEPSYQIPGPNISVDGSYNVSITKPAGQTARDIYWSYVGGSYEKYTGSFKVGSTSRIASYYITNKGERSETSYKTIYVAEAGKPNVSIGLNPDPYQVKYGVSKVKATITASNADKIEYSFNGIEYIPYTGEIEITKNGRIYAKGTNSAGETIQYTDITNIQDGPQLPNKLAVNIVVTPEPSKSTELIEKVKVSIEYDSRASKKYYRMGSNGELKEYTGEFEVSRNTTIYGYATSENGYGEASKLIDNLLDGISEPKIQVVPGNNKQSSKSNITITFDKNATETGYKINNDMYRDYIGPFSVEENCKITAYNENRKGDRAESSVTINNIVSKPPVVVIDHGKYYIIKLTYPPTAKNKEYKWQKDGIWKSYPEDGLLLVKAEYKDEILDAGGNVIIKIKDETGKEKIFNGDHYFITKSVSELVENIYMRWDYREPSVPEIVLNTEEAAQEVYATINYEARLDIKQYRIVFPDGVVTKWKEYKGETIKVVQKNTIIYAKGQDETGTWSETATKKITNIDEDPPVIRVTADLESAQQRVGIKVVVIDDVKVAEVKWAKGIQADSYFINNGTTIENESVVYATENGYYTIYAIDGVGNTATYTLQIGNVDLIPPDIGITVIPETEVTTQAKIRMDFGDSILKQYKIGESNGTWSNYTGEISVSSYTVLANKWQNSDHTVTIYGKGKDSAGNEGIISKKILNLDLDIPKAPIIDSNYGYPVLTEYGIRQNGGTIIQYDTRADIDNYYSLNNGATWQKYTGEFKIVGANTILAKSVKKNSGLEISSSKTITATMPADAIGPEAYDGNLSTGYANINYNTRKKIVVDKSMRGKEIYLNVQIPSSGKISAIGIDGIETVFYEGTSVYHPAVVEGVVKIPSNAQEIVLYRWTNDAILYEIQVSNEPKLNVQRIYPILTQTGVQKSHNTVQLTYSSTSVQRLYRIGTGVWKNYNGETIRLEIGQTIYAKGIDKYGKETRIISSYTATMPDDAIGAEAYDGNISTGAASVVQGRKKILVDSSMKGKDVYIRADLIYSAAIIAVKTDGTEEMLYEAPSKTLIVDGICKLPSNIKEIVLYRFIKNPVILYEIRPAT